MIKKLASKIITKLFEKIGLSITKVGETSNSYISAKETVSSAECEGLSVCDYVEKLWEQQGDTQMVIEQMASAGVFSAINPYIVEIGTGTGRYLEKALEKCKSAKYESYESAQDWAKWLQSQYPIVSQETDGQSLRQTPNNSVDIVHAHGVFVYLPFLISYRYWKELWRVVKEGGYVVFDIFSCDCLDEVTLEKWLISKHNYPCFVSKDYVVTLFEKHGFSLIKVFSHPYGLGRSEYLVFLRNKIV